MGQDEFILEIPENERESVLSGIEGMLKDDRVRMDEGALRFIPKNRAFVLPLMLNLGAIVVLAVGAMVFLRFFDRGESELITSDGAVVSAEGRILERLRRESQAELGAKNAEIADIRALLSGLEEQRFLLAAETEAKIAEKEEILRLDFEAALAAERARLADDGISGTDLTATLAAFEKDIREDLDSELAAARNTAEAEQNRRIAELDVQKAEYESRIEAADEDLLRIQGELETRKAELDSLEEQRIADADAATRQLNELRSRRDRESLITDQIMAFYSGVGTARKSGNDEAALTALDSLESYLNEDGIRDTAIVESRRETDTFLIGALRRLVDFENNPERPVETVIVTEDDGSALILETLSRGALEGTGRSVAGDTDAALQIWMDAFSAVPELETAFRTAIADAEKKASVSVPVATPAASADVSAAQLATAREEGLAEGMLRGRNAALSEAESELNAARNEGYASGRRDGNEEFSRIMDELEELKIRFAALSGRIEYQAARYAAALSRTRDTAESSQERLVDLLEAKIKIKSGLEETLHESLDEYADATGDYREMEAREAVYAEIVEFLTDLSPESEE